MMKLERQRRRRNRTTDEMTGLNTMKTSGKIEISFLGQGSVEVDNYSNSAYFLDGQDMFRKDSGGRDCFDRSGFVELEGLEVGKMFTLSIPSGRLVGRILEVRLENRDLRAEQGLSGYPLNTTTILVEGVWKGAKNGLLNGQSAAASFRPLDGEMGAEWKRRVEELVAATTPVS